MTEILLILLLLVANGVFALAEIAIVSSRRVRLQQRAARGDRGAAEAIVLASHPTRFLSTVQIGITLVGVLAGAFGGATLAERLAVPLREVALLARHADAVALAIVVGAITYLSLVIGELVPKRVALSNPERIAAFMARPMSALSRVAYPLVRLLSVSTDLVLRVFGIRETPDSPVTAEEIAILLAQGERAGIFEASEQDIVERALQLDDLPVEALATPRGDVVWLDLGASSAAAIGRILASPHTYFPVGEGSLDAVAGVVRGRDVLGQQVQGQPVDLRALLRQPLFLPENESALDALERFRTAELHVALLVDEFGGIAGLLTLTDVLQALVGEIRSPERRRPAIVTASDGSWSVSGRLPVQQVRDLLEVRELPEEEAGYETLAGLLMTLLRRVPAQGDRVDLAGFVLEVERMHGLRIDRVRVLRSSEPAPDVDTPDDPGER